MVIAVVLALFVVDLMHITFRLLDWLSEYFFKKIVLLDVVIIFFLDKLYSRQQAILQLWTQFISHTFDFYGY